MAERTSRTGSRIAPAAPSQARIPVRKTYKIYVGGQFPRSESGRSYLVRAVDGTPLANAVRSSRKDLRDAIRLARGAAAGWAGKTAMNRGQVLYRVAELMEGRRGQFIDEVAAAEGVPGARAEALVDRSIDRWVWYAGWADKISQLLGTVNPVGAPYFNFTIPEATGVVGIVAPEASSLLGLVSRVAPAVVGGNAVVALASETRPLPAVTLSEVLATSDIPPGVINMLTGLRTELVPNGRAHGCQRDRHLGRAARAAGADRDLSDGERQARRARAPRRRRALRLARRFPRTAARMDHEVPGDEDRLASDRRLSRVAGRATGERRGLLLLALLALVPFVLLAGWARLGSPAPWEPELLTALATGPGLGGDISRAINTLGNLPVWAIVVAVAAAVVGAARGIGAALLVAVSFASDLAAFGVKILVERERPETVAVGQFVGSDSFAYPSGHTVRAAALVAVVVWLVAPARWRLPLAAISGVGAGLVMGYARVSLGVHWPTDTIGGALLGLGWFAVTAALFRPWLTSTEPGR